MNSTSTEHGADVCLAAGIVRGSIDAWHEFVARYSGLILTITRRYLVAFDEDDRRDAYVRILEYFYKGGLRDYDGLSALSTWVITVSRSRCLDVLRSRHGRRRDPVWLKAASPFDRHVYRMYFLESQDVAQMQAWFVQHGQTVMTADLEAAIDRLDRQIDPRVRNRLAYDLQAQSVGALSGRLLEFLDYLRIEHEASADMLRPDFGYFEAQTRALVMRIQGCVERLEEPERRAVKLHFYERMPAGRIAEEMSLASPRRAYTIVERGLHSLRTLMRTTDRGANPLQVGVPKRRETNPATEGTE